MPVAIWLAAATAAGGQGGLPDGYYAAADGLSGAELRAALHRIVEDHHVIPYSDDRRIDVHDALNVLDEDPDSAINVILIYSQRSEPKENWDAWNREHTWPQSLGIDGQGPAYSDLHAIRACDASVNSSRGNKYYDVSDFSDSSYRFPAYVEASLCSRDSDSWEPPDTVKGDLARGLFYMDIRYEGDADEPDLVLTDGTDLISSATNRMGRLITLIKWHLQDPVDDAERLRNDAIYNLFQTNRNPFVDHPEWVVDVFVPSVSIQSSASTLRIRWPVTELELHPVAGDSPSGPWTAVTHSPVLDADGWVVELPQDPSIKFYKLQAGD